ncbi:MAG: hypothetical protein SFV54_18745 [Bryobacteraceae bacterium]|nr:hypothetical protein [Bryobacteraceae bacterium]
MKPFRRWLRRAVSPRTLARANAIAHADDRLIALEDRCRRLAALVLRERHPHLAPPEHEWALYSQNGEDALTLQILDRIAAPHHAFLEIGVEDGLECNSAILAYVFGWRGLMIEADPIKCAAAQRALRRLAPQVTAKHAFATAENINSLAAEAQLPEDLGLLSIDVDGVDYWLWKALTAVRPRLVIVEYNACIPPGESLTVPYDAAFRSDGFYHGASLKALDTLAREKGYALVAADAAGVNAFFVREDLLAAAGGPRTVEECYRPHAARSLHTPPADQWAQIRHRTWVHI